LSRTERSEKAHETLDIFRTGHYMIDNLEILCRSRFTTDFIAEARLSAETVPAGNLDVSYEVINESVVDVILQQGSCGVLNFASAKNPGGGFLGGAIAQEESLAVSSDLYLSQLQAPQFYSINRRSGTALYTHNMIYSRDILFIRDGSLSLIPQPVCANVLTCPAVNAGAFYLNEGGARQLVNTVMEKRIRYILTQFILRKDLTIVLGAYGCGVFQNDPQDVAGIFHRLLKEQQLERNFRHIIFAIYDRKGNIYNTFKNKFR